MRTTLQGNFEFLEYPGKSLLCEPIRLNNEIHYLNSDWLVAAVDHDVDLPDQHQQQRPLANHVDELLRDLDRATCDLDLSQRSPEDFESESVCTTESVVFYQMISTSEPPYCTEPPVTSTTGRLL